MGLMREDFEIEYPKPSKDIIWSKKESRYILIGGSFSSPCKTYNLMFDIYKKENKKARYSERMEMEARDLILGNLPAEKEAKLFVSDSIRLIADMEDKLNKASIAWLKTSEYIKEIKSDLPPDFIEGFEDIYNSLI